MGMMISTMKESGLRTNKLLLVRRAGSGGEAVSEPFVALDAVVAGEDELVLVAMGGAARKGTRTSAAPVDATIVGIIDSTAYFGVTLFRKGQGSIDERVLQ